MVETDQSKVTADLRTAIERKYDEKCRTYADIPDPVPEKDNPDALFANGWGRRGHFALLVAPSGVGKSVITTQDIVSWVIGEQGLIGSAPIRPLRIAVGGMPNPGVTHVSVSRLARTSKHSWWGRDLSGTLEGAGGVGGVGPVCGGKGVDGANGRGLLRGAGGHP